MIINGSIPGDPEEVAKAMEQRGHKAMEEPLVSEVKDTEAEETPIKADDEDTEKPEEKKKPAVRKGGRKSSKKAKPAEEVSAGLFNDENAE